jgi:hypothetical protein
MPGATRSRIVLLMPLAITFAAVAILLRLPPELYGFYPHCPIHQYLHILCPGCGATRALAALLRGNLSEALRLNALTTLLTPVIVCYAAIYYRRILMGRPLHLPEPPHAAIYATLAAAAFFTIARNL